ERGRQLADEADRVDEDRVRQLPRRRLRRPRVERREETVGGIGRVLREAVEERRLAGVGVSGDRDLVGAAPAAPAHEAPDLELLEVATQPRDAVADLASVELELLLARAAAPDAAAEAREMRVAAGEPRQQVLELGELDLRARLARARVEGEDVEDQ